LALLRLKHRCQAICLAGETDFYFREPDSASEGLIIIQPGPQEVAII